MTRIDITFQSAGIPIAGHLYHPAVTGDRPHPAVVVSHPAGGVKEQTAGLYARHLAGCGFATLAFDAAFHGESGGAPRGMEDPAQRIEDIRSAVSFLSVRDDVDPHRIGLLGICASAGYAVPAVATDLRVKALATVSGVDIGAFFRQGHDGKQDPAALRTMLEMAAKARTSAARGEDVSTFAVFPASEIEARSAGRYVQEGWEYYCTKRGQHPRSTREMPWTSVDRIAAFDGFTCIGGIASRPLLMIVGTEAETRWMAEDAYRAAREPKELFWIKGASHIDLYDRDEHVALAVTRLSDFYQNFLASG